MMYYFQKLHEYGTRRIHVFCAPTLGCASRTWWLNSTAVTCLHRKPYIARGPARNMLAFLVKTLEDLYTSLAIQNLVLIIADGTKTNTGT